MWQCHAREVNQLNDEDLVVVWIGEGEFGLVVRAVFGDGHLCIRRRRIGVQRCDVDCDCRIFGWLTERVDGSEYKGVGLGIGIWGVRDRGPARKVVDALARLHEHFVVELGFCMIGICSR